MGPPIRASRGQLPVHNNRRSSAGGVSLLTILGCFALSLCSFYSGLLLGLHTSPSSCPPCSSQERKQDKKQDNADEEASLRIPSTLKNLVAGMARVDRNDFFNEFDVGVPKDASQSGNSQVLMLYHHISALPDNHDTNTMNFLPVEDATRHCTTLKIVYTEPQKKHECMALVGQWESYHIQKYMRLPPGQDTKVIVDEKHPLRPVSRLHGDKGLQQQIPSPLKVKEYDASLVTYLSSLDGVLSELKPIAARVSDAQNTIIVMVCNFGQSELLMNFACSARARGLDLSHVLVFCTDLETKALASELGLHTFYDHTNFEKLPSSAARVYADKAFSGMMMAKVYCVHLINALGYNLLFQDVDVVWYQNPLPYFQNTSSDISDFDIYFQDDGAHTKRYAPYSPNSGFYFARHNERTEYFFHSVLMSGNIIAQSGSHQNAISSVLNEHASWRGLRVKTLSRDMDEFPGGYHFHKPNQNQYMKKFVQGKIHPIMFHMSWTTNKNNKKLFFEQMGDWYVQDECVGKMASELGSNLASTCCSAKPILRCHYRDKPSKIPCKDSPPIDKDHKSWW